MTTHREVDGGGPARDLVQGAPGWAVVCLGVGTALIVAAAVVLAVVWL